MSHHKTTILKGSGEENESDILFAEILDSYLQQLQSNAPVDRNDYLERYPHLASRLLPALESLEQLHALAPAQEGSNPQNNSSFSVLENFPCDFGDYELLEEIGRGGMGVVFKAYDKKLKRIVALKMILASHLASDDHKRRLQDEASIAASIQHPHVVSIHNAGMYAGQSYFTMDYIEGEIFYIKLEKHYVVAVSMFFG